MNVTTWVETLLNTYQDLLDQGIDREAAKSIVTEGMARQGGSYRDTADALSEESGLSYSRQAAQQLYKRRNVNGFPEKKKFFSVNVKEEEKFDLEEVRDWYHDRSHQDV